ncbi:MAG: response regulator transcription factor [Armatimonadetes bacterium]|nr:response regulator transcription factor [Armatimonadota bacterium]
MRILLVEDDLGIARFVKRGLEANGYRVDHAEHGLTGLDMALRGEYHLIILDIMLPGKDGFAICEEVRRNRISTPVLMLTARDTVTDKVTGLDLGADDYLPKPFDFMELAARVRALTRRDRARKSRVIQIDDLEIDTGARVARRAGKELDLSAREYELLEALASHEGQVLTRQAIQDRIWQNSDAVSNVVDAFIRTLRKKVDQDHPIKLIQTIYGLGYSLRPKEPGEA